MNQIQTGLYEHYEGKHYEVIGLAHHTNVVLGLDPVEQAMLLLTLFVSTITYTSGRTNVLQGVVHLMLLMAYLMLIIWH